MLEHTAAKITKIAKPMAIVAKRSVKFLTLVGETPVIKQGIPKVVAQVKLAASMGFVANFFGINQGSEAAPRQVDEFKNYALAGNGMNEILLQNTPDAAFLAASVFGIDQYRYMLGLCESMIRFYTPVVRKK